MKKIILLMFAILLVLPINSIQAQQDPEAGEILDKLSIKTKAYTSFQTKIIYRYEDKKEGNFFDKEGEIIMKGNKYKLSFMESVIFYNGKTMWNFLPENNEVNVFEPDPEELKNEDSFLENPQYLLNIYNEKYKYRLMGGISENGKNFYEIDLYPKNLDKPYSRIKLLIEKEKIQLYSAVVFGKDGINHLFTFPEIKTNFPVEDNFFTFNVKEHPGVEVIDLR